MDLERDGEQELLRETTARFIAQSMPIVAVRARSEDPVGFDRDWVRRSAELGWFAMFVPERFGGGSVSGAPMLDAAIVAEELGRAVQPGPFLTNNLAAVALSTSPGVDRFGDVLSAMANGTCIAATAASVDDRPPGPVATAVPGGYRVAGAVPAVFDGIAADVFVVTVAIDSMPAQVLVERSAPRVSLSSRSLVLI